MANRISYSRSISDANFHGARVRGANCHVARVLAFHALPMVAAPAEAKVWVHRQRQGVARDNI
ncbi:hypothetical protein HAQ01_13260 [Acidithiobacillus thiooxidans]|nr:hypothetical protein [Acidithiobacillus thiooxidans]